MTATLEKDTVRIFHSGKDHGPMNTAAGVLKPGESLPVPKALAEKLTAAYPHIKLASDIIPGSGEAEAESKKLKAELGEAKKIIEAGQAADKLATAHRGALEEALGEFLAAGSKKDLDALKEKHAGLLPAAPAADAEKTDAPAA